MESPTKRRSWPLWLLAVVLTLASAVYQRRTGPSYPVRSDVVLSQRVFKFKLPRSHPGAGDAVIKLDVSDPAVTGSVEFRRYPSHDHWSTQPLERDDGQLIARIPHQPPAGKVAYSISLTQAGGEPVALTEEPVIIRFRGDVPAAIIIPHIILVFTAMLLSTRTGLEALFKRPGVRTFTLWTTAFLFVGGMIGGPIVQKYAFGEFWTGWPRGSDLTDNKTAVAMVFWLIALWRTRKKPDARAWPLAAALVTLTIFIIPHSLLGSELDHTSLPAQPRA